VEQQLGQAQDELRGAENMLQSFLQENREYRTSPKLSFEEDRLARAVSSKQDVVNTLARSYEEARIEEVRNTPVLTVLEHPELPAVPDSRHIVVRTLLGALIGFMLVLLFRLIAQYVANRRVESPSDSRELSALGSQLLSDLRHPLRFIGIRKARAKVG
jgi:uncharacterized protein involved in exopolysaccharide biosynthesis